MSKRYLWQDLEQYLRALYTERFRLGQVAILSVNDDSRSPCGYRLVFCKTPDGEWCPASVRCNIEQYANAFVMAWCQGHDAAMQQGLNQLGENAEYWRTHFHYCSYCGYVGSGGPRPGCPFCLEPAKPEAHWILCSDQLPPYDEPVWLTLRVTEQFGKKLPFTELAWRVERGERHATNKHGEIWRRAGISGEMAWEVFSWTRSAQPALDARAGK